MLTIIYQLIFFSRTNADFITELNNDYDQHSKSTQIKILKWPWALSRNSPHRNFPKGWMFPSEIETITLDSSCGGCLFTNNYLFNQTAENIWIHTSNLKDYLATGNEAVPHPHNRPKSQYWTGMWRESAAKGTTMIPELIYNRANFSGWDVAFNLTLDMRRDADVWYAHLGNVHDLYQKQLLLLRKGLINKEILPHKVKSKPLAAAMISNCDNTKHAVMRMNVVNALLNAGLKMTGIGKCFRNYDHKNLEFFDDTTRDVKSGSPLYSHNIIATTKELRAHKFYLAFENGLHCRDYISEKLWRNAYMNLIVPVVYGPWRDDLMKRTPPHSLIFVEDYDSADELVDYLKYLDRNETAYMEYFDWRKDVKLALSPDHPKELDFVTEYESIAPECALCKKMTELKNNGYPEKIITSYSHRIWMDHPDDLCTDRKSFRHYYKNDREYLPEKYNEFTYADGDTFWLDFATDDFE